MKVRFDFTKNLSLIIAISLFVSLSTSGCQKSAAPAPRAPEAKSVKAVPAANSPIVVSVEYASKLKPIQEVNVSPEVSGKVANIKAVVGSNIEKGQPLFALDPADLQIQLKQQQANRDYYSANARSRDSSLEQQIYTAEQALNKAQIAYDDMKSLYDKNQILYEAGAVSKQALSDSKTKLQNQEIDLNNAKENLSVIKEKTGPQSVQIANAQLQQAQAGLESVSAKLQNSTIVSPISGLVSAKNVSEGELVSTSTRAFTIIDTSSLIAEVALPDKVVGRIKVGQTIPLKISVQDKKPAEGVVETISPSIDSSTQSYIVRIKIDNRDNSLKPGMFARAVMPAESKENALIVPSEAVKIDSGIKYIYTVEDSKVKKKAVTVGLSDGKSTEVLTNLKAGDLIITEGQTFLNDGERVKVIK